jgi:hypothetical protein
VLKIAHRTLNFSEKDRMMVSSPISNNLAVVTADFYSMSKAGQHLLQNLSVNVIELVVPAA